jgi:hypothetical protein
MWLSAFSVLDRCRRRGLIDDTQDLGSVTELDLYDQTI